MSAPNPMGSAAESVAKALPVLRREAAAADEHARFPTASLQALRDQGLLGLIVPLEYGGAGGSLATFIAVAQELAGACLSSAQIWAMHCFQVDAIVRYGSKELRDGLLPKIAAGEVYIASVTSERGRSASLFSAHAPLRPDGDHLLLERTAPVVTGGAHADGYLITMRDTEHAAEHEVTLVYAERHNLDVTVSGGWNPLGMRATESVSLTLSGRVSARNIVGDSGAFATIARESMIPVSHLGWSACWLGTARGALQELTTWLRRSGPSEPSVLFYDRLAHIRVDLELVSSYLASVMEHVVCARAEGRSLAEPRLDLKLNTLKLIASERTFRAVDRMIQLAGLRIGYMKDSPIGLERRFRDLRSAALQHSNDGLWVGVGALTLLDRSVDLA